MARFEETVNLQPVQTRTGSVGALSSLSDRLQAFSNKAGAIAIDRAKQAGAAEAQQVELQKKDGVTQAPEFKDVGFIGGVADASYNKALRDSYLSSIATDTRKELSRIESENPNDVTAFNDAAEGFVNGLISNVDPSVRQATSQSANSILTDAQIRVQKKEADLNRKEAIKQRQNHIELASGEAQRLAREGNDIGSLEALAEIDASLNSLVETGDMLEADADAIRHKETKKIASQVFLGQIDNAADQSIAEGFAKLDEMAGEIPDGWTPDEWNSLVRQGTAELNQRITRQAKVEADKQIEVERQISDLKIRARNNIGDAGTNIREADDKFDQGVISGDERASIITSVLNGQKESRQESIDFMAVANRLGGDSSQVLDLNQINSYWDKVMSPQLEQMPQEMQDAHAAQFVDSMKVVPTPLKNQINTNLRSEDPALIAQSADLIDRLDGVPGLVDRDFSPNDRAFARQVAELSVNLAPAEAVKLARQNTDPNDKARVESRKEQIKESKFAEEYQSIVTDEFTTFFGSQVDDINRGKLETQYKALFESHYTAGMDEDNAKEKAFQIMRRNWGEFNGRAMMYPVQTYYTVGADSEYIKDQLETDVRDNNLFGFEIDRDEIVLFSDDRTAREAAGGQPTYQVKINSAEQGVIVIPGFRWRPDMQSEIDKQVIENETELLKLREDSKPKRRRRAK